MGFLDFVKSDEKRASSPDDDVGAVHQAGAVDEVEEVGDDLHRGMKPRQLSKWLHSLTFSLNPKPPIVTP